MRKLDESYPVKTTILYVAVPLLIDVIVLLRASMVQVPSMIVFSAGGVLVCIPWGKFGAALCMVIGAIFGGMVAVGLKHLFHRYQPQAVRLLMNSRADMELGLVLVWAATAACAFHLTEWLTFPGIGGAIAAANALLGRALILPELNDLYWLAARRMEMGSHRDVATAQERAVTRARAS